MFCSKCGTKIEAGNLFCTKCGNKVEQNEQQDVEQKNLNDETSMKKDKQTKIKKLKIVNIIIILFIIFILVGIFLYNKIINEEKSKNLQNTSNITNNNSINEVSNNAEENQVADDILTVVSKEFVNTFRGFVNVCSEYGEVVETSGYYDKSPNSYIISIRVDKSKIDEVYNELSNNEQVLKVMKGYFDSKKLELYKGYEELINQLLNNEEEKNGFGISYGVVDINNDGIDELVLVHGKSRADAVTEFYTYQNNSETVKLGEAAQGELYKVSDRNELKLVYTGTGGSQIVWDISYDNDDFKINKNTLLDENAENLGEKIELHNAENM